MGDPYSLAVIETGTLGLCLGKKMDRRPAAQVYN